ncbi:DUF3387 domain-containing protein [candidate division KSB1 bacterium]|nr:MAG: DUF3387 domain-containing protein [candidate division KSB1 bacterium]
MWITGFDVPSCSTIYLDKPMKNNAVDAILTTDATKKEFMRRAEWIKKIYKAYLPDPIEPEWGETAYLIRKMVHQIRGLASVAEIDDVLSDIDALLDQSVQGFRIQEPEAGYKQYDLSGIDFEALRVKFVKGRQRTIIEHVRTAIESKLNEMVQINHTRMDWLEEFRDLIKKYQDASLDLDEFFAKLKEFAQRLDDEQRRFVREGLENEQQLAVFDLLTKPEIKLSKAERQEVKLIARELFAVMQEKMVLDWKKKQQTRARVKLAIQRLLDKLPAVYDKLLYEKKCDAVYKYVYNLEGGSWACRL